jgi:hypothetical protein
VLGTCNESSCTWNIEVCQPDKPPECGSCDSPPGGAGGAVCYQSIAGVCGD